MNADENRDYEKLKGGDAVFNKKDIEYDAYTIIEIRGSSAICIYNNPKDKYVFKLDELEAA